MPRGGERGALLAVPSSPTSPRRGYGSATKSPALQSPSRRQPPATGLDFFVAQRGRLGEPLSSPPGTRTTDDLDAFAMDGAAVSLRASLVDEAGDPAAEQPSPQPPQRQADARFGLVKVVSTAMLVVSYVGLAVSTPPPASRTHARRACRTHGA
jgi:hypothetical protein